MLKLLFPTSMSFSLGETSDGVSKSVHKVFASMLGENEDEEDEE